MPNCDTRADGGAMVDGVMGLVRRIADPKTIETGTPGGRWGTGLPGWDRVAPTSLP